MDRWIKLVAVMDKYAAVEDSILSIAHYRLLESGLREPTIIKLMQEHGFVQELSGLKCWNIVRWRKRVYVTSE